MCTWENAAEGCGFPGLLQLSKKLISGDLGDRLGIWEVGGVGGGVRVYFDPQLIPRENLIQGSQAP